jgi:radical SAM protein with 4Fe4S-binding SPASM domain
MANAVVEKYRARVENSKTIHLRGMPIVTQLDGKTERKQEYHTACEIPFYSLFIKFDGKVSVCCVDLFDDIALGNINDTTLSSIINGEKLRAIRRHHLDGDFKELPICLYCGNRTAVNVEAVADELKKYI